LIINVYHPVLDQKDVLGLNTIHFSLSRDEDHSSNWFLHCSVVMRTIDVLSGLPYDIYAVCRFARYVARRAEEMLPPTTRLTAQHVMILALNLHLYCDELNLGIARRIAENG
jgi:thymidylate synthase